MTTRAETRAETKAAGASRLIKLHEDDGAFDRAFWASQSPASRLEAVWGLALEYLAWREPHAGESRLQRSVCRLERRGR